MNLFERYKEIMLDNEGVFKLADEIIKSSYKLTAQLCRKEFSDLVTETEKIAYDIFLKKQKEAGEKVLCEFMRKDGKKPIFTELDRFFLSLAQARKARAGAGFENIIKNLFRRCSYPFEEHCVINGEPDFLMPSKAHYKKFAPDCIIFTAKRTIRERWRQIATEGVRGLGFFLATIDEKVTKEQIAEMLRNRIYLVVPENIKKSVAAYRTAANVKSFEDFFTDHLDDAVRRWRRAGVIR